MVLKHRRFSEQSYQTVMLADLPEWMHAEITEFLQDYACLASCCFIDEHPFLPVKLSCVIGSRLDDVTRFVRTEVKING